MLRIGIVVQRYGKEVVGGAETLARDVAERLNASGTQVTVFTTTAKDYITWKPHFPTGDSILKGVAIKRYDVAEERNIERFNAYSTEFFSQDPSKRDETRWLREQGPYVPDLLAGLQQAQADIDVFIFFTYLYYTTIAGLQAIAPDKPAVLFPTAHDEAPIYMKAMTSVFSRPHALFFLTGAEMAFVQRTFQPNKMCCLVRSGTDIRTGISPQVFQHQYLQYAPYILYAGRIERGKGLEPVFEAYREMRQNRLVDFVLIGKQLMDIPSIEGLKYVGFVSEEEKLSAFKGAVLSVQPSPVESLSITTLESFSQETPVLVNKKCHVLCEHVDISGGGFAYDNVQEFLHHFYTLYDHRKLRQHMGRQGFLYVSQHYAWDIVIATIKKQLAHLQVPQ